MTERRIQAIVGVLFIASHILILALVAVFYIMRGFTFEEMTTTMSIIAPVFAGYTLIITRAIIADRHITTAGPAEKKSNGLFVFLSLFVPLAFVVALVGLIVLRAYNVGISSFEQFKTFLALIEGVFAVYLGPIIQALFSSGNQTSAANGATETSSAQQPG